MKRLVMILGILLCGAILTPAADVPVATITPEAAAGLFQRFQALSGRWAGKSTRGWEEENSVRTIAGGSVVLFTSFDAHPGETMITTVHLNGDELMLTHYCIAGNQPRMTATSMSEDGRQVVFTFRDATNLTSRDQGHMDKAVFRFVDDDQYTSQWTWYQDGKESWMEKIVNGRLPQPAAGLR